MESEATTPEVFVVKAEPESEPAVQTPQPIDAVDERPDENPTPASTVHKLQAVVREKTDILEKLSTLEKEEAPLKQRLNELMREKSKMHVDSESSRTKSSAHFRRRRWAPRVKASPRSVSVVRRCSAKNRRLSGMVFRVRKRRMTDFSADTSSSARKSAKRGTARDCVTFKQLQDLVDDLKQEGRFVGELECPVCHAKRTGPSAFVRHLYFHLGTKGHHFYKCPFEDCGFRTVLIGNVKAHVAVSAHKAAWTEDMNDRCIVQNNFDAFNALCRQ